MGRMLFVCLCIVAAALPALAQNYQQYHDGLVAVQAKKVLGQDQQTAFDVCAQLMRDEKLGPLEVRLNLWTASGAFIRQLSLTLQPRFASPSCQQVQLPQDIRELGRWEIARFRFLPEQTPRRVGRLEDAG